MLLLCVLFGASMVLAAPRPPQLRAFYSGSLYSFADVGGHMKAFVSFPAGNDCIVKIDTNGVTSTATCSFEITNSPMIGAGILNLTVTVGHFVFFGNLSGSFVVTGLDASGQISGFAANIGYTDMANPGVGAILNPPSYDPSKSFIFALQAASAPDLSSCPKVDGTIPLSQIELGKVRVMHPGGNTGCLDGSPFQFYVRRGDPEKIVVNFMGGGVCFSAATCIAVGLNIVSPRDNYDCQEYNFATLGNAAETPLTLAPGVTIPPNPFANYTYVYVPMCTIDLHVGNSMNYYTDLANYGIPVYPARHNGYNNTQSVLNWVYSNFQNPAHVVLSGCSAGGFGSSLYAGSVANHYSNTNAKIMLLSDSAAGVVSDSFLSTEFRKLHTECSDPVENPAFPWLFPVQSGYSFSGLPAVYEYLQKEFPLLMIGLHSSVFDFIQILFAQITGIPGGAALGYEASLRLRLFFESTQKYDNIRYFSTSGSLHCVSPFSSVWFDPNFRSGLTKLINANLQGKTAKQIGQGSYACPTCSSDFVPGCDQDPANMTGLGSKKLRNDCGVCNGGTFDDTCPRPVADVPIGSCPSTPAAPIECNKAECKCPKNCKLCRYKNANHDGYAACSVCKASHFLVEDQYCQKTCPPTQASYQVTWNSYACNKDGPFYCVAGTFSGRPDKACSCKQLDKRCTKCYYGLTKSSCLACRKGYTLNGSACVPKANP